MNSARNKSILLILMLSICLALSGCGGMQSFSNITAKDHVTNTPLTIKYRVNEGQGDGSHTYFLEEDSKDVFDEISDIVDIQGYDTNIYQNKFLTISKNNEFWILEKAEDVKGLLIDEKEFEGKSMYHLYASVLYMTERSIGYHVPYHLFIDNGYYTRYLSEGNDSLLEFKFVTDATIEDFVEFYENFDCYVITELDNVLKVEKENYEGILEIIFSEDEVKINLIE